MSWFFQHDWLFWESGKDLYDVVLLLIGLTSASLKMSSYNDDSSPSSPSTDSNNSSSNDNNNNNSNNNI